MAVCFMATRKVASATRRRKGRRDLILKPLKLDNALRQFVGASRAPRSTITKKVWGYAKRHGLQRGSSIKNSKALKPLFGKKPTISFGDVAKMIKHHST